MNLLLKFSDLKSDFRLTLSYLSPALNNLAQNGNPVELLSVQHLIRLP